MHDLPEEEKEDQLNQGSKVFPLNETLIEQLLIMEEGKGERLKTKTTGWGGSPCSLISLRNTMAVVTADSSVLQGKSPHSHF